MGTNTFTPAMVTTIKGCTDDTADEFAKEITEEFDFQIMAEILTSVGWTEVFAKHDKYPPDVCYNMLVWLQDNCKGAYKNRGKHWIFERAQDAAWFSLRWGSE